MHMKKVRIISITSHFYLNIFTGKNARATIGNPTAVDADGLLMDVDVQSVEDNQPAREDKTQDVDQFFYTAVMRDVNGKSKKYRTCKLCL